MKNFSIDDIQPGLAGAVAVYLEQVTGESPRLTSLSVELEGRLPAYLHRAWQLKKMRLLERAFILALPRSKARASLSRLIKDQAALTACLETEVIPVITDIQSYERRRLIHQRVPFIVPGRQLFLPIVLVDFREIFGPPARPNKKTLSWVAQLIVLRHLLQGDVAGRPLGEVAERLGYSAMAITQAVAELEALDLCTKVTQGRARTIHFNLEAKALWEYAAAYMRSPVQRRYPIAAVEATMTDGLIAGLGALSTKTDIANTGPQVLALPHRELKQRFPKKMLDEILHEEDAGIILEGWAYAPQRLSEGPEVDDLSLYLSMRHDADERVQMALTDMMDHRKW